MGHADPERRVVVGGPGATGERDRREVVVVERAPLDSQRIPKLHSSVRMENLVHRALGYY